MHSLITRYARLIANSLNADARFADKVIAYMKARGHLTLLPAVLRAAERRGREAGAAVVTLARAEDAKQFGPAIAGHLTALGAKTEGYMIKIDDRMVGGYMVRAHGKVVDQSYRTALVSLYQHSI